MGVWRLRVHSSFAAAHQILHYGGPCEALHGHNFAVTVEVEGNVLDPKTGMLMDFKILKGHLAAVLAELDHTHINTLPQFAGHSPSSERLAQYIFQCLARHLEGGTVRLVGVRVAESPGSEAEYWEE
jgi:6-pyruvoyltetrahydropterin/6-carboxytetrahydropterin synthase